MVTLLLHTSALTAHLGLADGDRLIAQDEFPIDRQLAETFADRITKLAQRASVPASQRASDAHAPTLARWHAIRRIVVHAGPGGFTALRIGVTTANALAYALGIPVVGITGAVKDLYELLATSQTAAPAASGIAVPEYDKPPDIGPIPSPSRG